MCVCLVIVGGGDTIAWLVNIAGPLKYDPVVVSIESPLNNGYCSSAKHGHSKR